MQASFEGHANVVQTLIEAKAQINTQEEVYVPFIKYTIGEDWVFVSTQGGWTALHLATHEGKVDVVRLLLTESQTLVNVQTEVCNCTNSTERIMILVYVHCGIVCLVQDGGTPLMAASFEGHADIAQTLIEAEAQINAQDEVKMFIVYTTISHTSGLYTTVVTVCLCPIQDGWTALHLATQEGEVDVVKMAVNEAQTLVNIQTEV